MRVDQDDAAIDAALDAARTLGLYVIVRVQHQAERRLTIAGGAVERKRTSRSAGVGVHVFAADGSVGFASIDDAQPAAVAAAVRQAGALAALMHDLDGARTLAPFALQSGGRLRLERQYQTLDTALEQSQLTGLVEAQAAMRSLLPSLQVRTSLRVVDEEWRIARSDGTDISYSTPRASLRHELTGRIGESVVRASASVSRRTWGAGAAGWAVPSGAGLRRGKGTRSRGDRPPLRV